MGGETARNCETGGIPRVKTQFRTTFAAKLAKLKSHHPETRMNAEFRSFTWVFCETAKLIISPLPGQAQDRLCHGLRPDVARSGHPSHEREPCGVRLEPEGW